MFAVPIILHSLEFNAVKWFMSIRMAFFEQMRLYFIFFIFFGLWSTWQNNKYRSVLRVYSACCMQQEFLSFVSVIYSYNIFENNSLSATIANWLYIIDSLTHVVIVFESLYKRKAQLQLIRKFCSVDELFRNKLGITIPYRREKCTMLKLYLIILVLLTVFKTLVTVMLHHEGMDFAFWFPALYSTWIMRLRTIQVLFFVCLTYNRLLIINKELKSIRYLREMQTHHGLKSPSTLTGDIFNRILKLKNVYEELYETCTLINETFGWSLLAIYVHCFVDFTCNCYWAFIYLGEARLESDNILISAGLLLPIIILLGTLTFFCSSCSGCVSISSTITFVWKRSVMIAIGHLAKRTQMCFLIIFSINSETLT